MYCSLPKRPIFSLDTFWQTVQYLVGTYNQCTHHWWLLDSTRNFLCALWTRNSLVTGFNNSFPSGNSQHHSWLNCNFITVRNTIGDTVSLGSWNKYIWSALHLYPFAINSFMFAPILIERIPCFQHLFFSKWRVSKLNLPSLMCVYFPFEIIIIVEGVNTPSVPLGFQKRFKRYKIAIGQKFKSQICCWRTVHFQIQSVSAFLSARKDLIQSRRKVSALFVLNPHRDHLILQTNTEFTGGFVFLSILSCFWLTRFMWTNVERIYRLQIFVGI